MIGDKYLIKFIIPNEGDADGEIIRIRGPHLTEIFVKSLPINSRGLKRNDMFIIPVNTLYSIEKPSFSGSRGDIIYDPKSKAIIILLTQTKFDIKIANIGKITKNVELFANLKMSSGVRIERLV